MSFGRREAALGEDPLDCDLAPITEARGRMLKLVGFYMRVGGLLGRSIGKLGKDLAERSLYLNSKHGYFLKMSAVNSSELPSYKQSLQRSRFRAYPMLQRAGHMWQPVNDFDEGFMCTCACEEYVQACHWLSCSPSTLRLALKWVKTYASPPHLQLHATARL